MKPINVGLLGIGTVGGGTFTVLKRNAEEITRRAGRPIRITAVADKNLELARRSRAACKLTDDAFSVVTDPEIDIVVELIGGYGVAKELVLKAIENGKHVVTANKALLAVHGNEIFAAAQKKGVMVAFEAAVAGGIPIIKALREGLTANRIEWLAGIINGTTNFILSEMRDKGLPFADVLKEAQALGYAEADPTFDIEGVDAAHKATIMSAIAFGIPMQFDKAYIEGISKLDSVDIKLRRAARLPHQAAGHRPPPREGVELRVHPTLIPEKRLIANVEGAMNAVLVQGDAVGATLYYGKGAGAEPTASAVIADLVDVTRLHTSDPEHRVPHLAFQPDQVHDVPVLPIEEVEPPTTCACASRTSRACSPTSPASWPTSSISIDAMLQRSRKRASRRPTSSCSPTGLVSGVLMGALLIRSEPGVETGPQLGRWVTGLFLVFLVAVMVSQIPAPTYRWSEEKQIRQEIGEFLQEDAAITRAWESLLQQGGRKGASPDAVADLIESVVAERYEHSFEELAALPQDPNLPSAQMAEDLARYAEQRRDASREMVEGLRAKDPARIKRALEQARQSGKSQ
jgi:homoserine dehydrogenase